MARRTVTSALTAALRAAQPQPADTAAVALATRYAALIDAAAPAAVYQRPLRELRSAVAGTDAAEALVRIETALAEHSVASDLGPKLLAALTALGMTPAARAAVAKGGQGGPAATPLDEIRQRREARQRGAPAVDPAAG